MVAAKAVAAMVAAVMVAAMEAAATVEAAREVAKAEAEKVVETAARRSPRRRSSALDVAQSRRRIGNPPRHRHLQQRVSR